VRDETKASAYDAFLATKAIVDEPSGIADPGELPAFLFPFQRDIVGWALRRGRAAIFADCGMGKTPMQLVWADRVAEETNGRVLILAPLAVAHQTVREGQKFGIDVTYARKQEDAGRITITNYEMLDHFDPSEFEGVVLDESSILKSYTGSTRTAIIEAFGHTPFRLACTATPAPNDFMELGNHSTFLGVMPHAEMLATFFVHDGGSTQNWRLKGHAETDFWKWLCSWAIMITKPCDLGYDDADFVLPELRVHPVVVEADHVAAQADMGTLFALPAQTMQDRRGARKASISERVEAAAAIVAEHPDDSWIVWCGLNAESDMLTKAIPGAVEVKGADSPEHKAKSLLGFAAGDVRVLVSKASIAGFGMNFQVCHRMVFVGLSDSYEAYYQAVRRCWRFGQTQPVDAHVVTASNEGAVVANIRRKELDAAKMAAEMVEHMADITSKNIRGTTRMVDEYQTNVESGRLWTANLGDCIEGVAALESDSIGYSVFSPPFASLYTYSASPRDMGNCRDYEDFAEHFKHLVPELLRVTKPGRLCSFHCMNLPTSKVRDGVIGLRDFRGELIRMFVEAGWIYHSEVVIWKDPVTAMQRTKALGLLFKQIRKDSCMSRQGIPDYLVTMRKPGDNPDRVGHTAEEFPVTTWQRYASPVWMDVNASRTLQKGSAREHDDERHICPLQLDVIERAIDLWSKPGDLVLSPFMGIGSEGYVAVSKGRRFVGFELKRSYWQQAVNNLREASEETSTQLGLFAAAPASPAEGAW
jgi:hypothetical protein